jgi:hypothetical protein
MDDDLGRGRPLRRRTDRVRAAVGWAIVVAELLTLVLAVLAGLAAYRDGLDRAHREAAARTTVVAVLLDDAPRLERAASPNPVRASYTDQAGRARTAQVPVSGFMPAGTRVRVEVDADGQVGVDPPSPGDAVLSGVTVGTGLGIVGSLLLMLAWLGVRHAVAARNVAAWEREWRLVEPRWSGRRV